MSRVLKGGIIGCGFFAQRHIEGWRRIPQVTIVAAADPQLERARAFAGHAYGSAGEMLDGETLDFVDIATRVDTHLPLLRLVVERKIPVVCQKPIAPDWPTALEMVELAEAAGVPFMIHENWRWQAWFRVAQQMIARGDIGAPIGYGFRTRTRDGVGIEPYPKQPYFRYLQRLLIDEALVHHIDTARFLFGDIASVYAQGRRRNPNVTGEDHAFLILTHAADVQGWIDGHRFLDPCPDGPAMGDAFFEGERGILAIPATGDIYLNGAIAWKNDVSVGYRGDSVRATLAHFIACLENGATFESSGREYLKTFGAVEAAYRSLAEKRLISMAEIL